jgi:hypothetical protein
MTRRHKHPAIGKCNHGGVRPRRRARHAARPTPAQAALDALHKMLAFRRLL